MQYRLGLGEQFREVRRQPLMAARLGRGAHLVEGETITPMLERRFTLNPVLVIMALIFWYWMWGVPGAILAVPMLAITKIIWPSSARRRARRCARG